jgi:preprotein translocase subunit YajC
MSTAVIIQLVIFVAIFYFMLILPQRKEQKRLRDMLAALRPGDEVVTAGGLIGEIILIKDDQVSLKSGEARLLVERARIVRKVEQPVAK